MTQERNADTQMMQIPVGGYLWEFQFQGPRDEAVSGVLCLRARPQSDSFVRGVAARHNVFGDRGHTYGACGCEVGRRRPERVHAAGRPAPQRP